MTYLEYWEQQFPEFMAKANSRQKELLSRQDPKKTAVYDEKGLKNLLNLLIDFDEKVRAGKLTESIAYQQADKELQRYADRNLTRNGFAQAGATFLITAGLSIITDGWFRTTAIWLIIAGIVLAIVGRLRWGITVTQKKVWDTITTRFNLADSPELKEVSIKSARRIIRILILIPACSAVMIVTGLLANGVTDIRRGWLYVSIGIIILAIDLIVIGILNRD